jgi:hypothetical protein
VAPRLLTAAEAGGKNGVKLSVKLGVQVKGVLLLN